MRQPRAVGPGGLIANGADPAPRPRPGRVLAGTSGFAYPTWSPTFYPAGLRSRDLLAHYALRLPTVELNNTFYARPTEARIAGWTAAVPAGFRFVVKAQRGASFRALRLDAAASVAWLTEPLGAFGDGLGAVLFRVPAELPRDDAALDALLRAWPSELPLVVELGDPSWHVDEVFDRLRDAGAVLCATDLDEEDEPPLRRIGPFLYLRLRRAAYDDAALDAWAARVAPFVADGLDAYMILRHDGDGTNAVLAERFAERVARLGG